MKYEYRIAYIARTVDDEGTQGEIQIETEKALETPEDLQEVSRQIRRQNGYAEVALNKITQVQ